MKEESKTKPDAWKVFTAIALIISRRGEGDVRLVAVRRAGERKAG